VARRDVHHSDGPASLREAPHRLAQERLDMDLALADAAPADRVEVEPVDEAAERAAA
jgi:hypothetical protein